MLRREEKADSPLFELARVLLCFNHIARFIVERESQRHVSGCGVSHTPIAVPIAFGSADHKRPNGSASEIRSTPR
jgi:hypothetical protein